MFKLPRVSSKSWFSIITSLVMMLAGLSACAQGQNSTPTFSNNTPITIGTSLSFSGGFAQDGEAMAQGYQLWQNMVNQNGGILGRPVNITILHDDSSEAQVQKNYTTLINNKVDLLFGPFSTLLTKAAEKAPGISKYAFIEGAGGGQSVFTQGYKNLFDVSLPVANNLITFAYYILSLPQQDRPQTAAYLTSDDPFTQPQIDIARALLTQGGVRSVYYHVYPEATTQDFTPYARQVAQSQAQVDILGTLLPDITAEIKVFKQVHYNPAAIIATAGPDLGQDFLNAVGGVKYANGIFVPNGWYPQADNFQNAEMVQAYLAAYGGTLDQINADIAEAFSVGQVLQQAAEKIQSIDNTRLIAELSSGEVFNTVQGTAQFDPATAPDAGENKQGIAYLFQWQAGQFIPVYPYSVAMQNPVYPRSPNF